MIGTIESTGRHVWNCGVCGKTERAASNAAAFAQSQAHGNECYARHRAKLDAPISAAYVLSLVREREELRAEVEILEARLEAAQKQINELEKCNG